MPGVIFKLASAVALALGLSACATHQPMIAEQSYVDAVDVRLDVKVKSPRIADALKLQTRREATRYGRSGALKRVEISVMDVHYKNAAMALLVGDSNRLAARVKVVDVSSGRSHGEFETVASDSGAINGVMGAVIAIAQSEAAVDQRLAQGLASDVLERIYGTAAATEARKREPVEIAETPASEPVQPSAPGKPAAPAAAPKPASPKVGPVAKLPSDPSAVTVAQAGR